jgi:hypothetical protein
MDQHFVELFDHYEGLASAARPSPFAVRSFAQVHAEPVPSHVLAASGAQLSVRSEVRR